MTKAPAPTCVTKSSETEPQPDLSGTSEPQAKQEGEM